MKRFSSSAAFAIAFFLSAGCKTTETSSITNDAAGIQCPVSPSAHSCVYYDCLEEQHQCGAHGYPLGYGDKYCKRFQGFCNNTLTSPEALSWVQGTTLCLQKKLEEDTDASTTCTDLSTQAFDSHAYCYTKGSVDFGGKSFCSLGPSNWTHVFGCIDNSDKFGWDILRQIRKTASGCVTMFVGSFFLGGENEELPPNIDADTAATIKALTPAERDAWRASLEQLIQQIDETLPQK